MDEAAPRKRPTVRDLARAAGVSLATVDRVLNRRRGVRPQTIERVEAAIAEIGFSRDVAAAMLARGRPVKISLLLPLGDNEFVSSLVAAAERGAAQSGAQKLAVRIARIAGLSAQALSAALDRLDPADTDAVIAMAVDAPQVRGAVARAAARGIFVVTLVSDLPHSARGGFVGIDNLAAGRTAAALMGRFCPKPGKVGLIAGSRELRDHRDRLEGFAEVLGAEFGHLELVGPLEGHDEAETTRLAAEKLIAQNEELCGLYSVGAGNLGLIEALNAHGQADRIRVIAHELTPASRAGLMDGTIDAVLDQDPVAEIGAAFDMAWRAVLGGGPAHGGPSPEAQSRPVELRLYLRHNMPQGDLQTG